MIYIYKEIVEILIGRYYFSFLRRGFFLVFLVRIFKYGVIRIVFIWFFREIWGLVEFLLEVLK